MANAEYSGEKENKKKDKKPYVAKYHYFKTNVKIGNKTYQIIFDTEEYNNPQSATTSIPVVSKEHSTDSKLPTAQYVNRILKPLSEDTNSITNSDSNFNPKTVHLYNITELKPSKIHYQTDNKKSALDYNYITNQVTGEKIKIEMNEDIKVDKIEPQEISSELPFKVSQKPSDNKKSLIKSLGLGKGKFINAVNNNTGETAKINDKTIEKSLSNISVKSVYYNDFCNIVLNVENLFKSSQKILSYNDTKKNTDTKIARYANIAHINNKDYLLEFVLKNNGEVKLYSINVLNNRKQYRENASSKNLCYNL